jgi:predicted transcriptional regulator
VKKEETDWLIYHLIAQETAGTVNELVEATGIDAPEVRASLERLERYLLIEIADGKARVLSVGESILKCQMRDADDFPLTLENGIVKVRKP